MRLLSTLVGLALAVGVQPTPIRIRVAARAIQPGEIVVLAVTGIEPAAAAHVRAFDRDWPGYRDDDGTWRAIIGIDLDVAAGDYAVAVRVDSASGTARATHTLAVTAKPFRTRTLTVNDAFVNPPEGVQARIEREAAELNRIWTQSNATRLWTGPFARPVPHEANSAFGTRSVFNGQPRSPHGGADFPSPAGTPVVSPNAGRVALAGDLYYTGGSVIVDHGLGLFSFFAHLSSVDVKTGDAAERGTVLGKVGATGRVTGAHLHWTLRANGVRVDPLSLIAVLGESGNREPRTAHREPRTANREPKGVS